MHRPLLPTQVAQASYQAALEQQVNAIRTGCPRARSDARARLQRLAEAWRLAAQHDVDHADSLVKAAGSQAALWFAKRFAAGAHLTLLQAKEAVKTPGQREQEEASANADYYENHGR